MGGGLGELRVVETEESGRKNEDEGLEILADEYWNTVSILLQLENKVQEDMRGEIGRVGWGQILKVLVSRGHVKLSVNLTYLNENSEQRGTTSLSKSDKT